MPASAKEDKRKGHTGWPELKMYSFVKKKKKKTARDATKAYFKLGLCGDDLSRLKMKREAVALYRVPFAGTVVRSKCTLTWP